MATLQAATTSTGAIVSDPQAVRELCENYCFGTLNWEVTMFRDALRDRPAPRLSCPECPNNDVAVGQKSADGAKVQRWFDCPDCGYEALSRIVYGAER